MTNRYFKLKAADGNYYDIESKTKFLPGVVVPVDISKIGKGIRAALKATRLVECSLAEYNSYQTGAAVALEAAADVADAKEVIDIIADKVNSYTSKKALRDYAEGEGELEDDELDDLDDIDKLKDQKIWLIDLLKAKAEAIVEAGNDTEDDE